MRYPPPNITVEGQRLSYDQAYSVAIAIDWVAKEMMDSPAVYALAGRTEADAHYARLCEVISIVVNARAVADASSKD